MLALNKRYLVFLSFIFIVYILQGEALFNYIFYISIICLTISLVYIFIVSNFIDVLISLKRTEVTVGETVEYESLIKNNCILPVPFLVIITNQKRKAVWLGSKSAVNITNKLLFDRRGIYDIQDTALEINDILFISSMKKLVKSDVKVIVYPKIYKIEENAENTDKFSTGLLKNNLQTEDYSMISDVRKYYYGDNLNKIHWKASAKLGELYVKNFEMQNNQTAVIIIDMSENEKEYNQYEESMISYAASLIKHFFEKNISIKVYINNKEEKCFEINSDVDFSTIMNYFIIHKCLGRKEISKFLKLKGEQLPIGELFVAAVNQNCELEKEIIALRKNGKRCKVICFNNTGSGRV